MGKGSRFCLFPSLSFTRISVVFGEREKFQNSIIPIAKETELLRLTVIMAAGEGGRYGRGKTIAKDWIVRY